MPSPQLTPVLVAVARTGSGAGVRAGAAEARRTRRPLVLVHVTPLGDPWLRVIPRDSLNEALELGREEVRDRTTCELELLRGDVIEQLRRRAGDAAMLVVERSESGRHLERRSTTVQLADEVETTTLVVPAAWTPTHHAVVTLGLDPQTTDDLAVRTAVVRARLTGSVLRVVVVGEGERSEVQEHLDRAGADACDIAIEMAQGSPAGVLVDAATGSDLVVLGRHARSAGRAGGGVGHLLVNHLACPALLCPPGHVHVPSADVGGRDRTTDATTPSSSAP